MKQEYQDFLFQFIFDGDYYPEIDSHVGEKKLLIEILTELDSKDLYTFATELNGSFLLGLVFYDSYRSMVPDANKLKFLSFTWDMFCTQMSSEDSDGSHPWRAMNDLFFDMDDPWFREDIIRHEFPLYNNLYVMCHMYCYGWWKDIEHFLAELCEFQTKYYIVPFLEELGKKIDKVELLNIHIGQEKS
tara:strand:- start:160 stop:723 length:564 start_codon:yes stop_codon:yes gene_type:complete